MYNKSFPQRKRLLALGCQVLEDKMWISWNFHTQGSHTFGLDTLLIVMIATDVVYLRIVTDEGL